MKKKKLFNLDVLIISIIERGSKFKKITQSEFIESLIESWYENEKEKNKSP